MKTVANGSPVRPSAQWQNRVTSATKKVESSGSMLSAGQPGIRQPQGLIYVQNNSGEDRKRFEILGIDDIQYGPDDNKAEFQNNPSLIGVTPKENEHAGNFVICAEPIADQAVGRAWIFGVCPVQIDIQNVSDGFADVDDNEPGQLKSGQSGAAQILWTENDENGTTDTGIMWALVRLTGPGPLICLTAQLSGKSGTRYDWQQAAPDSTTGAWSVVTDGKTGSTTDKPAIDLDASDSTDLTGKFVVLVPITGSDGKLCYAIAGTASSGSGITNDFTVLTSIAISGTTVVAATLDITVNNGLITAATPGDDITLDGTDCSGLT